MNSRRGSGGAPAAVTQPLNSSHSGRCARSYSARNRCQPDRSAAAYPENAGGTSGPLISSGLHDTMRTNGTPAATRAGKQTTLSSTITSGRTRRTISSSGGWQYLAPRISSSKTGLIQVSSCSMVGLRNSGAVCAMYSFQNCPGSASWSPGGARSTSSSAKPSAARRPFHDASAANTTRCPRRRRTSPMPMQLLVGPYALSGASRIESGRSVIGWFSAFPPRATAPAARRPQCPASDLLPADHDAGQRAQDADGEDRGAEHEDLGRDADAGGAVDPYRERDRGPADEVRGDEVIDGQRERHQRAGQHARHDQRERDLAEGDPRVGASIL